MPDERIPDETRNQGASNLGSSMFLPAIESRRSDSYSLIAELKRAVPAARRHLLFRALVGEVQFEPGGQFVSRPVKIGHGARRVRRGPRHFLGADL